MYVAVKGGEKAIAAAHALLAEKRRGDRSVPEIGTDQIREQLSLAVDRVMSEGSLYDRNTAALAVKQARGDLVEAIFLVRAYRTTLPRFGSATPLNTENMRVRRRISATYKDVPGGQVLGPTFDYTHRLLDPSLARPDGNPPQAPQAGTEEDVLPQENAFPKVLSFLEKEGLLPEEGRADGPCSSRTAENPVGSGSPLGVKDGKDAPGDLTRQALQLPAGRDIRLQNLARGDEGLLLALAYSTQRGFGSTHPFAGEIRMGEVEVTFTPEELGFPVIIGEITLTECETVNKFTGGGKVPPSFTRGYGLTFGEGERKAMSMALVDRSLRAEEFGEAVKGPAQDAEFVLYHSDNVEASGFVQHLKLPHYVDFQAELELVRSLRRAHGKTDREGPAAAENSPEDRHDG